MRTASRSLPRSCLWPLAILVALCGPAGPRAAIDRAEVEAAVTEAQELAAAGGLAEADRLLRDILTQCGEGPAGLHCRPLVHYTQGYLRQQQARRDPESRARLLDEAATWYAGVLNDVPDHGKTMVNLANIAQAQGALDEALSWLQNAVLEDPDERGRYTVLAGDLLREQSRWDEALSAYERAASWSPDAEAPRLALVETLAQLPDRGLGNLTEQLPAWRDSTARAAAAGYKLAIERSAAAGRDNAAERYLLEWVSLLAEQGWLTPQRVADLREAWPTKALTELGTYFDDPAFRPEWWRRNEARRHGIALAALAAGRLDLARLGPEAVEARWQVALRRLAPEAASYSFGLLKGRPHARLELQTELGALYHQYPHLDDGNEFQDLIWSIFEGKGEAYGARDQATIQRHHIVLGEIYAEDPSRETADFYATNAAFQLHRAIEAGDRLVDEGEAYQPLARLKQTLAEVCEAPSEAVQRQGMEYCEGRNAIDRRYLDAAKAYLDSDRLERAGQMLKKAGEVGLSHNARPVYRDLELVLGARAAIETLSDGQFLLELDQGEWLRSPALDHLPEEFTHRQNFKALSDYVAKTRFLAEKNAGAVAELEEVRRLLDRAAKGVVLAGAGDELRVKALADLNIRNVSTAACPGPRGQTLRWVQEGIKQLSAPDLMVDGIYGQKTQRAIREFQSSYGLEVDGKAGTQTKAKLRELLCKP